MRSNSYLQSNGDHTLFYKHSKSGKLTVLVVYVDDIIITNSDDDERERLDKGLMSEFAINNLGQMKFFLGIEVAHSGQGILLSQQKYILDLLIKTGFSEYQPARTPIELNHKLTMNESEEKWILGDTRGYSENWFI